MAAMTRTKMRTKGGLCVHRCMHAVRNAKQAKSDNKTSKSIACWIVSIWMLIAIDFCIFRHDRHEAKTLRPPSTQNPNTVHLVLCTTFGLNKISIDFGNVFIASRNSQFSSVQYQSINRLPKYTDRNFYFPHTADISAAIGVLFADAALYYV